MISKGFVLMYRKKFKCKINMFRQVDCYRTTSAYTQWWTAVFMSMFTVLINMAMCGNFGCDLFYIGQNRMIILTRYKCQKNKIQAQYVGKNAQSLDFYLQIYKFIKTIGWDLRKYSIIIIFRYYFIPGFWITRSWNKTYICKSDHKVIYPNFIWIKKIQK